MQGFGQRARFPSGSSASDLATASNMTMGGRILVVDDNRDAANTLARLLSVLGHEARVAYGGSEALEIATEFPFDMAFIDIGMPDPNGYETVARLRQNRMSADVVMVALTGWSQEQDKQQALEW